MSQGDGGDALGIDLGIDSDVLLSLPRAWGVMSAFSDVADVPPHFPPFLTHQPAEWRRGSVYWPRECPQPQQGMAALFSRSQDPCGGTVMLVCQLK